MTKKKKSKIKGNKLTAKQLQNEIYRLFKRQPRKRLNPRQVIKKLKITNNRDSVQHALDQLVENNLLISLEDYKYKIKRQHVGGRTESSFHEGYVDMTRTGAAYIVCDDLEDDVYVAAKNMNTAMHGDRVEIKVWTPPGRRRSEGEVVNVLERATEHFLGTIQYQEKHALVTPDKIMAPDIFVRLENTKDAEDGDKVVVKMIDWRSSRYRNPEGIVETVLGKAGTHDIEMKAILINNGFNLTFPENVIQESEGLPVEIGEEEIAKRRDLRETITFTIDPDTAKDFDDALSIRFLEDGACEIGVHIADVSHYVLPETALDKEALERSTSVYLVDRVLPMLPEKLSNELCSLRPNEDKLTFSAIFEFDKDDKITSRWFGKTVIHSDRRFTYDEVQDILDQQEGDFFHELWYLNRVAHKLRRQRFKKGAINFETEEVKFRLDENNVPVEVYVKERKDAHMLIEDFMLLANREVAEFVAKKGEAAAREIPFVYRIHDDPNPDKVAELALFAKELGFQMDISSPKTIARSYNRMIKAAETDYSLKLLEPIAIRTMAKAEYSTQNIGHYGLAFDFYSHFTSPIRRYSDVLAHRILEKNLGEKDSFRVDKEKLEEKCKHISMQERKAMDAERESVKYKQVEFLEKHIGEVFDGFINGFSDRGMFVELKGNRCEGMVSFDTMPENFEMSNGRLRITGLRTGTQYKMGDPVKVQILACNLEKRQIDMAMLVKKEREKPLAEG